jgi:HEAT repeat protein
MRWAIHALAACLALAACEKAAPAPAQVLDERLELLFDPAQANGYYDVELADIDAVLIQTLQTGQHDALRRAKMELAGDGERGIEALRRLVERYRSDPGGVDYLRNAVDALALSPLPSAARVLWTLIDHPSESLRVQVMRGLLTHPQPESFDPVLGFLAGASDAYQGEACGALGVLDLHRAQELWLGWVELDANPHLRQRTLSALSDLRDPDQIERVQKLLERDDLDRMTRLALSAPAARAGDAAALAYLREKRESSNMTERDLAVRALVAADRIDELSWTLSNDVRPSIRILVVRAAADRGNEPVARALLEQAANDSDPEVSRMALEALAQTGAPAAIDRALLMLDSKLIAEVGQAVEILAGPMQRDPELARRVWSSLRPRLEFQGQRTPFERSVLIKVLGVIPLPDVTAELHRLADSTGGEFEFVRARRFVLMQSVNAGPQAQDALLAMWKGAEDATLRLDALEALSAPGDGHARELLLQVLDDPRTTDTELVFVADRLVRIGPAREVAWQLKRAALRVSDERARRAFQGVLWRWYPAPKKL